MIKEEKPIHLQLDEEGLVHWLSTNFYDQMQTTKKVIREGKKMGLRIPSRYGHLCLSFKMKIMENPLAQLCYKIVLRTFVI